MIRSWANAATRRFAETGKSKFGGLDTARADLLLRLLDRIRALNEISRLKSFGLHPLKRERKRAMGDFGRWSVADLFSVPRRRCL
jgi:proteic killer suppression protein